LKKVSQAGKGELVFAGALFLVSLVVFWDTHRLVLPTNNTIVSFWGVAYAFGAKKIVRVGAISLLFAALVYFSFTNLLDIQLPQWVLEEWISKVGA